MPSIQNPEPPIPSATSTGELYPPLEPYANAMMDTGEGHRIYFEECGSRQGIPVVVLHGGPASGCSPLQRRFFDPAAFRIVLFDQRGCGRSTPRGSIADNDTAALIRDIEQLRLQLGVERWIVFGGSWGASLAIAYAAAHPKPCLGIILRGSFLTGSRDLDWFFGGAGSLLPAQWRRLVDEIGLPLSLDQCEHAGHAVLATLRRRLFADDPAMSSAAAVAWANWEDAVSRPGAGRPAARLPEQSGSRTVETGSGSTAESGSAGMTDLAPQVGPAPQRDLVDKYRVQAHYLEQQCFLGEEALLSMASRLDSLPVQLVHGRLDWVCRPANAWRLHQAIASSNLAWVDGGSHSPYDPPMLKALGEAIRRLQDCIAA